MVYKTHFQMSLYRINLINISVEGKYSIRKYSYNFVIVQTSAPQLENHQL